MAGDDGLPRSSIARQHRPLNTRRVEVVITRATALLIVAFGLQSLPAYLATVPSGAVIVDLAAGALHLGILVVFVAALAQRRVRLTMRIVCALFIVNLVVWPFGAAEGFAEGDTTIWLYRALISSAGCAAIAFSWQIASVYLLVVPIVLATERWFLSEGTLSFARAALESAYVTVLGGAVITIIAMLRLSAVAVDEAQAAAVEAYDVAVRSHAIERERIKVDSIVHDSILTSLLSASRANTPESRELAVRMAESAISTLRTAALDLTDDDNTVSLRTLAGRITEAAGALAAPFEVRTRDLAGHSMPAPVADALYSATVQAMVNSVQHAGSIATVNRWVVIRGSGLGQIDIDVGDTGSGFDPESMRSSRLGVRVSIVERVSSVGGAVEIDTALGEGTVFSFRWPSSDSSSDSSSPSSDQATLARSQGSS
jgi:signal transduction histidine kinase